VDGGNVIPRHLLLRLFPPTPTPEEIVKKLAAGIITDAYQTYVVEIVGENENRPVTYTYTVSSPSLRKVQEMMPGATHESYLTGTSAAAFTEMLGEGKITVKGVIAPECLDRGAREEYLARITKLNVKVGVTVKRSLN